MKKRVLSMVLCGMLCMSMVTPQAVYAEEFSDNSVAESVEEAADVELFGDFAEEAFDGTEAAAFSDTAQAAALREERIVLNVSSGMDIAKVANDALGKAKKTTDVHYTVVIPPGNYTLSSSNLYIFSNTTLEAEGAVITKAPNLTKMIKAGTSTYISQNPKTGYDMFTNITINGGVWDNQKAGKTSSVKFGHASNITLKNMEFRGNGAGAHFLEVGGVDGLTVENCKFIGHQPSTKFVAQEAIELECVDGVNFKEYAPNNNLPCKNISITGCTFDDLMGGVGMHNAVLGNYTDNVNVSNNTFKNIGYQGIIMTNARNLTISNNTFTNVLCGIEVEALNNGKAPATPGEAYNPDMNIKISGNTMSLANVLTASQYATLGISLKGTKFTKTTNGIAKGTYKLSNALVQNNTITGSGRGMLVEYADNCQILNNKITFKKLGTWKNYTGYGMVISKSSNNNLIKVAVSPTPRMTTTESVSLKTATTTPSKAVLYLPVRNTESVNVTVTEANF